MHPANILLFPLTSRLTDYFILKKSQLLCQLLPLGAQSSYFVTPAKAGVQVKKVPRGGKSAKLT
jgi:hypothetical protein